MTLLWIAGLAVLYLAVTFAEARRLRRKQREADRVSALARQWIRHYQEKEEVLERLYRSEVEVQSPRVLQ